MAIEISGRPAKLDALGRALHDLACRETEANRGAESPASPRASALADIGRRIQDFDQLVAAALRRHQLLGGQAKIGDRRA
jgi:hypothetical protein